jgi:hypothetical protein
MKYKVTINSNPEFTATVTARTVSEAKRPATRSALLAGIKVFYSNDVEVEGLDVVTA